MRARLLLIMREIFAAPLTALLIALTFLTVTLLTGAVYGLGDGFRDYITNRFAASIPPDTLRVSARAKGSLFSGKGSAGVIHSWQMNRIAAVKGVAGVDGILRVPVPQHARVDVLGHRYSSDLVCVGVPYRMIRKDIASARYRQLWLREDTEMNLPVLIPGIIMKAYNSGIAEANGLPPIAPSTLTGFSFRVIFGKSSLKELEEYEERGATIAGFTDAVQLAGLVIPMFQARRLLEKYAPGESYTWHSLYVRFKTHDARSRVEELCGKMGLEAFSGRSLSGQLATLQRNGETAVKGFLVLFGALAFLAVMQTVTMAVMDRLEYFRVMRITGASTFFISFMLLLRTLFWALGGAGAGLLLLGYLQEAVASYMHSMLTVKISLPVDMFFMEALMAAAILATAATVPALLRLFGSSLRQIT